MEQRVLIVDDSAYARATLKHLLETHGLRVVGEASSALQAADLFSHLSPDLVTMDIVMEEYSGVVAIKMLRALDPDARIIVITSSQSGGVIDEVRELGVKSIVYKPIQWPDFENALAALTPSPPRQ